MANEKGINSDSHDYHHSNSLTVESFYNIAEGTVTSTLKEGDFRKGKTSYVARGKTTFQDGERSVDFVLVWDSDYLSCAEEKSVEKRKVFEGKLLEEGLELELEPVPVGSTLHFIKIHAPLEVLRRYSEILKLRMPMRKELCIVHDQSVNLPQSSVYGEEGIIDTPILKRQSSGIWNSFNKTSNRILENFFYVDKAIFPDRRKRFTAIYSRDKQYLLKT